MLIMYSSSSAVVTPSASISVADGTWSSQIPSKGLEMLGHLVMLTHWAEIEILLICDDQWSWKKRKKQMVESDYLLDTSLDLAEVFSELFLFQEYVLFYTILLPLQCCRLQTARDCIVACGIDDFNCGVKFLLILTK